MKQPLNEDMEVLRPDLPRGRFRSVLFDFDGTLSLIREGWPQVMIPMMVEVLRETGTKETEDELRAYVENMVMRLTGRQTIYQMIQLADEVRHRGGQPKNPLEYKNCYLSMLMVRIRDRIAALESGQAAPSEWSVPGSHALLENLHSRGMVLYLASGTDIASVKREVEILGLARFFGANIYGALDDYRKFSKKMIVEQILREHNLEGEELLSFGDGYVEIEEVRKVGGVAVAVASDEVRRHGIDPWKRERLIRAGADVVIPEYRKQEQLIAWLFAEQNQID
jgi:phosphoglycolate phosphatase-like HAD superfamily hydrolase